jgi:hypothetical protein
VPEAANLAKASLRQVDADFANEIEPSTWCTVQFNPDSLKVSFANQLVQPPGAGDQRGTSGRQFVGAGTTKLATTLWFDVGSPQPSGSPTVDDVRKLTQKVAFFITPKPVPGKKDQYTPPGVRFIWGSFQFDGLMDSLEETLEFFSPEGKPLRASLALTLSQQRFQFAFAKTGGPTAGSSPGAPSTPGTQPLSQATSGSTLPGLADAAGLGAGWQAVAAANGIENARVLDPGQLVDMSLQAPQLGGSLGISGGFAVSASAGAGVGPSAGVGISADVGVSAGASVGG